QVKHIFRHRPVQAFTDIDQISHHENSEQRAFGDDQERDAHRAAVRQMPSLFQRESVAFICLHLCHGYCSNFQSGSWGCFKSHKGRLLRTTGSFSKLYSGGGENVAHSSVQPSQGSSPAFSPERIESTTFQMKSAMAAACAITPSEEIRFQKSHPRSGAYV